MVLFMSYQIIGKVSGVKGLKGELKIKPLSGFMNERLAQGNQIYFDFSGEYKAFTVKSYRVMNKTHVLLLENMESIELVDKLLKKEFYASLEDELNLEENVFHEDDLIGLKVYQNKILMGEVIDIRNYPKDDYLVIKTKDKEVLIPFRDEFILSMDNEMIDVIDMEGLF